MTATWPKSGGVETDPIAGPAVTTEAARASAAEALKQDASTAATDLELAGEATARDTAIATHAGLKRSVHGIPSSVANNDAIAGDGSGGFKTVTPEQTANKGAANGYAGLDANSLVTPSQRAATYGTLANRPVAGTAGDRALYFATDDNGGTLYQVQSAAWVKIAASAAQSGGAELGYAEIATNPTSTTTYPARTDVAGLSITVTVGTRPIKVIFDCADLGNDSTGGSVVSIMEGSTELQFASSSAGANIKVPIHREVRLAPTAGSHTYKIAITRLTAAGTTTLVASGTPAFIQAVEC